MSIDWNQKKTVNDLLNEAKNQKMVELNTFLWSDEHPSVYVPLEDTSVIYIPGGRDDQFDIRERYELMKEESIPSIYLKDYDGTMQYLGHLDIRRCYKAITIYRNDRLEYQWEKESEITAATNQAELDAIIWE